MYIPQTQNPSPDLESSPARGFGAGPGSLHHFVGGTDLSHVTESPWLLVQQLVLRVLNAFAATDARRQATIRKRSPESDVTIGIVVGVLLGIFLVATCGFLWVYRFSVRFTSRRHHKRKSSSSKSSKSSKSSDGGGGPPPPPPPAGPA